MRIHRGEGKEGQTGHRDEGKDAWCAAHVLFLQIHAASVTPTCILMNKTLNPLLVHPLQLLLSTSQNWHLWS